MTGNEELMGKVAIVTGGSFGIGRATAIRLVEEGAKVTILARGVERLQETAENIERKYGKQKVLPIQGDVSQESTAQTSFQKTIDTFGRVDIVVSNAGWMTYSAIEDTSLETWNQLFSVIATASFFFARKGFKYWKTQKLPGNIVFVTSKAAQAGAANNAAYSSAKAGVMHLARCLAEEGGPYGIRVNCVSPGAVLHGTALFTPPILQETAAKYGVKTGELEDYYANRSSLKVMLTPDDVAEAILFLCGPRSAKITGTTITVDAGLSNAYLR